MSLLLTEGQKFEKFGFLGENFPEPEVADLIT